MRSAAADGAAGSVVGGLLSSQHPVALVGALFNTCPPAPVKLSTHIFDSFTRLKH